MNMSKYANGMVLQSRFSFIYSSTVRGRFVLSQGERFLFLFVDTGRQIRLFSPEGKQTDFFSCRRTCYGHLCGTYSKICIRDRNRIRSNVFGSERYLSYHIMASLHSILIG